MKFDKNSVYSSKSLLIAWEMISPGSERRRIIHIPPNRFVSSLTASLVLTLVGNVFLRAETRESGGEIPISITVETVNSGGTRLTDGSLLRIDSNVGGIAGAPSQSLGEPAQFTSLNGYLGQLFDAIGLAIELDPATVNEEGTAQLDVAQEFDDGTFMSLDPTDVDWSVQSGPVISILESGQLNADTVVSTDTAVIAAAYLGTDGALNITVLNVDSGITGDGLPDAWQLMFFMQGDDSSIAGPNADPDNDGLSNFYEYVFNLIPTDTNSGSSRQPPPGVITFTGLESLKASVHTTESGDEFLALTFRKRPDSAGLDYIVEVASTPSESDWEATAILVGPPVGPDGDGLFTVTYRDNISISAESERFIRIRVVKL